MSDGGICPACGVEHLPRDAMRLRTRVVITAGPLTGRAGHLREWGRYGGPMWYRVQLDAPDPRYGGRWRENVMPCEVAPEQLEAAPTRRMEIA